ncbi:glycosyl hydrolase catalytic core-domain-containing protein [Biscogniauxia mediterranea]|nr:glycosyl hydrolase catalytic core-domain-containing protein [Biscogniauxia mediterranea]
MYSKLSVVALCAAASIKEVSAGHVHRHMHPKREIVWAATETEWITDYVTVTVTEGEEPTAAAVGASEQDSIAAAAVVEPTTSSSSIVVLGTTSPAVVAAPTTSTPEPSTPVVSPTTMVTSVKASPVVESPVAETSAATSAAISAVTSSAETSSTTAVLPITNIQVAATSTYSAAAASTSAASTSSSSSTGKRGAAYNDASLVSELLNLGGQISWAYNWGSDSGGLVDTVTYYPMLWSSASEHSSDWDSKATAAIASGSDCLLSFNEPDISTQANMGAADAAAAHIKFMNPYASQARIGSPAISSSENANQGIDWLTQFFTACNGECQVDFCAAHWYGPGGADGAAQFLQHLTDVHTACENKNVWVTEFAAESGSVDDFMTAVVDALETDEYSFVEKYSYFMVSEGSLLESATSLSSFGKIFAGVA